MFPERTSGWESSQVIVPAQQLDPADYASSARESSQMPADARDDEARALIRGFYAMEQGALSYEIPV